MLEKLFDYTPEELAHILSLETLELMKEGVFANEDEDQAIEAAFALVALELSENGLEDSEVQEAVDKVKLYVQTNDIKEN